MKKIDKMVDAYNKCALKHGYPTIKVDYEKRVIIGEFVPKDENQHKGFIGYFKNLNTTGWNASLSADYKRIEKELAKGAEQ